MRNELILFAQRKEEKDLDGKYQNLSEAIDSFVEAGNLTSVEGQLLKELNETKHRQLASIWRVYEVIKQKDDMLHSLRVFVEIMIKKQKNGGEAASKAAEAPFSISPIVQANPPQPRRQQVEQPIAPNGGGMMSGFIKLNAMPSSGQEEDNQRAPDP